jgi:deoxyribonuclease-4
MVRAADRAAAIGASALQVFSDNPTSWRRRQTLPRELPAFRNRLDAHGIAPLSIHAPYLINLAGSEPDLHAQSVSVLANELRVAAAYGARFVNVHVGSHRGAGVDAGVDRLAHGIRLALELAGTDAASGTEGAPGMEGVILVLENGSGAGFGMGASFEELRLIDEAVMAAGVDRERFGFCLDTAHAWGAGYPIDTPAGVDETLDGFDRLLGLGRLHMVHVNDSRSERGSLADRHEHIGAGRIGGAGLGRILTHPALGHVAYYLETPGMESGYDAINLARARDVAAGRPLADLPPEAFETRASRGHSAPPETEGDLPAAVSEPSAVGDPPETEGEPPVTSPRSGRSGR